MATLNVSSLPRKWTLLSSAASGQFSQSSPDLCFYCVATSTPADSFSGHPVDSNKVLDFINPAGEKLYVMSHIATVWSVTEGN